MSSDSDHTSLPTPAAEPTPSADAVSYRALLRLPGAVGFFTVAACGRVGVAMSSLGLVWLVQQRTGSYAAAGLATAAFAVAEAVLGPQLARLVDRWGQRAVLPPQVAAHVASVAGLLALLQLRQSHWSVAACAALMGATIPSLGALSAARWAALVRVHQPAALPTAFSLESVANAVAYLAGPVLVSAIASGSDPALGTALAAALIAGAGVGLAAQPGTAPPRAGRRPAGPDRPAPLLSRRFIALLGINLGAGAYFGAVQVSVAAFAVHHGAPGTLYALSGGSSLAAGWLYGLRRWRTPAERQLPWLCAVLTTACLVMTLAGSVWGVGFGLVVAGLVMPPILVLGAVLTEVTVHPGVLTQAMTWLNSACAAGTAAAASLAGHAIDEVGPAAGFGLAAAAASAMTASAGQCLSRASRWRRSRSRRSRR